MRLYYFCVLACLCVLPVAGCGPELAAAGGGVLGGLQLSETVKGMQADLERREAALVQRYNDLVAAGAKASDLAEVTSKLQDVAILRQGVDAGGSALSVNWNDPKEAGGAMGLIGMLAYSVLTRKRVTNATAAFRTLRANADEAMKHLIDQVALNHKVAT